VNLEPQNIQEGRHPVNDSTADPAYQVVVNHEQQYSVWSADREPPDGWHADGFIGSRHECLHHISTVWTDLRPLSARAGGTGSGPR
jgi:MbtH protein